MKTLVIANQKGGVGKTTIAVHLATQAANLGLKTLFIDMDVQGNSSEFFVHYQDKPAQHLTASLFNKDFVFDFSSNVDKICIFAANQGLADLDFDLQTWKKNITSIKDHFDVCVIDTPPTLGLSQVAPFIVADYVLAPIELGSFAVKGAASLIITLSNIQAQYNPNLKFLGLLPSRVNKNNNRQLSILSELAQEYQHLMYPNQMYIPERQAFADAAFLNQPIWQIKEHTAKKVATASRPIFNDIINRIIG